MFRERLTGQQQSFMETPISITPAKSCCDKRGHFAQNIEWRSFHGPYKMYRHEHQLKNNSRAK
jgi:hypothetical protein